MLDPSGAIVRADTGEIVDPDDKAQVANLLGDTADTYARASWDRDAAQLALADYDKSGKDPNRAALAGRITAAERVMADIENALAALFTDRPPTWKVQLDAGSALITYGKARETRPPLSAYLTVPAAISLTGVLFEGIKVCAEGALDSAQMASYLAGCVQRWLMPEPTTGELPCPKITVRPPGRAGAK